MYSLKYILILSFIICFIFYLTKKYIYSYPPHIQILQTKLDNFYYDLLLEKQPLIIQDRIKDINNFVDILSYNYVSKHEIKNKYQPDNLNENFCINKFRYLLIYNNIDNVEEYVEKDENDNELLMKKEIPVNIHISIPSYISSDEYKLLKTYTIYDITDINVNEYKEKNKIVIIRLYPYQTLILPFGWLYWCETPLHNIYLNDTLYSMFR